MNRLIRLVSAVLVSLAVAACDRPPPSASAPSAPFDGAGRTGPGADAPTTEELDRLRALPYAGYVSDDNGPEQTGVVLYDPQRSCPGYTLYTIERLAMAELIDESGRPVRVWRDEQGRDWYQAELLAEGDLLVVGSEVSADASRRLEDESRYVARYRWDGGLVWKRHLPAHHDIELTPSGKLLTMTIRRRRVPEIHPTIDLRDEELMLLEPDGTPIEHFSLYDVIQSRPDLFPLRMVKPNTRGGIREIDLFHSNSVEWMPHPHLRGRGPIYGENCVLVSFRNQDRIAVFDWARRELVWVWGDGELSGQHDAQYLPSGNILVFDNGLASRASRVIELDPSRGEIVWQYRSPVPGEFYTLSKGGAQRLPNGNTLIAHSDSGHAFEVTPEGQKVWEFFCPHRNQQGQRATIVRAKRYERAWIDALLAAGGNPAHPSP